MCRLLLFGGTTEGRVLAEFCVKSGFSVTVSVATAYGAALLPEGVRVAGKRNMAEIRQILEHMPFRYVVDATHPFAVEATANIRAACAAEGVPYIRLVRENADIPGIIVHDSTELTAALNAHEGRILSTLGSKLLPVLTGVRHYRERIWARVLPTETILQYCEELGFDPTHILTEQPPFSVEQNLAHIRKCGAAILVSKESGNAGGYPEKCEAARISGITLMTLCRPPETGMTLEEAKQWLKEAISDAC